MREVKAFIRRTRTNDVIKALRKRDFKSMTITEVEGTGRYTRPDSEPSLKFPITHCKMTKLELICKKEEVEAIVDIISEMVVPEKKGMGLFMFRK